VNIPAWAIMIDLLHIQSSDNVGDIRIVNNIISNCFTSGGGQAVLINLNDTQTEGFINTDSDFIVDYNLIYAGDNGSSLIGYNGSVISYADWKSESGCNKNGLRIDPLLDSGLRPASASSPVIDAGYSLSRFFNSDFNGTPRPRGSSWDIGAFEGP